MITAERQTCATCKGKALLFRVWGAAAKRLPSRVWTECRSKCYGPDAATRKPISDGVVCDKQGCPQNLEQKEQPK